MKVIDLFTKEVIKEDIQNQKRLSQLAIESTESAHLSSLVHLEGGSSLDKKKVAIHISEAFGAWSFLDINDAIELIRNTHNLEKLGSMVIFVPEVTQIPLDVLFLIHKYVSGEEFGPLVITATEKSLKDLENPLKMQMSENIFPCFSIDRQQIIQMYTAMFTEN